MARIGKGVSSCADLVAAWEAEPRYLLRELAALLPESRRPVLVQLWPKVLVLAERHAAKRRKSA